jgi:hypothetical protein
MAAADDRVVDHAEQRKSGNDAHDLKRKRHRQGAG